MVTFRKRIERAGIVLACLTTLACQDPPIDGDTAGGANGGPDAATDGGETTGMNRDAGGPTGGESDASPMGGDGGMTSKQDASAGADAMVFVPPPGSKVVFASSTIMSGKEVGGPEAANATCGVLATNAGLSGTFAAWLSTSTASAATRLAHHDDAYVRTDGMIVANDWADLTDGTLARAINKNELGATVVGDAWTGTLKDGSIAVDATCADWTSKDAGTLGKCGSNKGATANWTEAASAGCSNRLRIICVEQ